MKVGQYVAMEEPATGYAGTATVRRIGIVVGFSKRAGLACVAFPIRYPTVGGRTWRKPVLLKTADVDLSPDELRTMDGFVERFGKPGGRPDIWHPHLCLKFKDTELGDWDDE